MKKPLAYFFICLFAYLLICLFTPTPSFAVVGQLIYDTGPTSIDTPQQTCPTPANCDTAIASYKSESEKNDSLYKACQLQKSQFEQKNTALMNSLNQERKKVLTLEILAVAFSLSLITTSIIIAFLRKKPSAPTSSPTSS